MILKDYLPAIISIISVGCLVVNSMREHKKHVRKYANNVAVWSSENALQREEFFISNDNNMPIYYVFVIRGNRGKTITKSIVNTKLQRSDVGYARIIVPGIFKYTARSIVFKGHEMGKGGLPEEYAILFTDTSGYKWMRNSDGELHELEDDYYSTLTHYSDLTAPHSDMTITRSVET